MKPAQQSLLSVYRASAADGRMDVHEILPYWMAAVGRELGRRTRPTWLGKGRLTIEVDGVEWRNQMYPLSGQILARLNKLLGEPLVSRIDYRVAQPVRRPPGRAGSAAGLAEPLDEASGIEDPQLRRLYRVSMNRSR